MTFATFVALRRARFGDFGVLLGDFGNLVGDFGNFGGPEMQCLVTLGTCLVLQLLWRWWGRGSGTSGTWLVTFATFCGAGVGEVWEFMGLAW